MTTDNAQIIVEHIINIDTTAENITSVNAVAAMAMQVAALAGMLPDVAASVQLRAELLAVSRNLGKIGRVSDALPLLEGLQSMMDNVTAVLGARAEIAAVVAQLHAITRLAAELDTLAAAPEHAESARKAAEAAEAAVTTTAGNANAARTSQLNAEAAETAAKAAADKADGHEIASAVSAAEAKQAADAAAAVSGLPDAASAAPGDPIIWTGEVFGMGGLDETLTSRLGVLGISDATRADIAEIRATAEGVDAKATQAQTDAADAKTTATGVDEKATQAASDAASAKSTAEAAATTVNGFAARLGSAEEETNRVSLSFGQHTGNGDIHTPFETITTRITEAVNGAVAQIRDGGTGTLPEHADTLQKLADLLDELRTSVTGFLDGAEPDQRFGMLSALGKAQQDVADLMSTALLRSEVVDELYSEATDSPLSAAQGSALRGMVEAAAISANVAAQPWIKILEAVPVAWPNGFRADGLLLVRPAPNELEDAAGADVPAPEWYIFDRVKPAKLVISAMQVRMADGTTVQSSMGGAVSASAAAQTAAVEAKTLAAGVSGIASQAQADAAEAKSIAEGVDAKATAAQTAAATALNAAATATDTAEEALAKAPALATQTTPGIVMGSDTVEIGEDGSVNVVGGAGGGFIGQIVDIPDGMTLPFGYYQMNGDTFNLSSPQGVVLNSFSDDFKINFRISLGVSSELIVDRYPAMTSDSDPAPFKCRSSSAHGPQYAAWKAFNKRDIDGFDGAVSQAGNRSIVLEFSNGNSNSGDRLARYDIRSRNDPPAVDRPDRWTLYVGQSPDFGVNDYAALDTVVCQENGWEYNTLRSYNIYDYLKKPVFGKIKFEFSRTQTGNDYIAVGEIKLYTVQNTEGVEKFINVPDWHALYPANLPLTNLKKCIFLGV